MDVDCIHDLLKDKLEELTNKKEEDKQRMKTECLLKSLTEKEEKNKVKKEYLLQPQTWKEKINKRRQFVAQCLQQQPQRNLAEVCHFTGCSYSLVKRVADDLAFKGEVSTYFYPNQKSPSDLAKLTQSISQVNGTFATIADLKRRNPTFSRKFIHRQLKQQDTDTYWSGRTRNNPNNQTTLINK